MTQRAGACTIELRAATAADEPFLQRLFTDVRGAELAPLALDEAAVETLMHMQYTAQTRSYAAGHPGAVIYVIVVDGEPCGRLWVDRSGAEIVLLDIGLLTASRGRGVGSALLGALIDEARGRGCLLRLHVQRNNPARRLYERLGFRVEGDGEVHLAMAWDPARPRNDQPNTAS